MLRVSNLKNLIGTTENFNNFVNLQALRWRRKPRWLPVAKSKMYRIPPRTITPEDEKIELRRLYNNYRTQMKGIRSYLHSEYNVKSVIVDTEEHEKRFMKEFQTCSKINDEWNEERRQAREVRHASELERDKQIAYKRLDDNIELQKQKLETIEEIVRREKEHAKYFITPENLDEAIEKALANPVDHNFAIDLNENIYSGRNTKVEEVKQQAKSSN